MLFPADLRAAAVKRYARDAREWAADARGGVDAQLELGLRPPTEREVLEDWERVHDWVRAWREAAAGGSGRSGARPEPAGAAGWVGRAGAGKGVGGLGLDWETRRWASVGEQHVPVRARLVGSEAIAKLAGSGTAWARLRERAAALRAVAEDLTRAELDAAPARPAFAAGIRRHAPVLSAMPEADFGRLVGVLQWVGAHPTSGRLIRQLPIRGVDTKWIGDHRGLVTDLAAGITGLASLGLAAVPALVRVRFLDVGLRPGGLDELAAPVDQLARLAMTPDHVLVFENLESVAALPALPGTVAIHGSGYTVGVLSRLPWAQDVLYWGDLDTNGFNILHLLRSSGVRAESVLMEEQTLDDHLDLAVVEPAPKRGPFATLTLEEQRAFDRLVAGGDLRLEQERIEWDYALERLSAAIARRAAPA